MLIAEFIVALLVVVVAVAAGARRLGLSAPLILTIVGIGIGFIPGMPTITVDREVVLLGLLPPLLYAAAIRTSLIDLRANLRSISMLSVGLVIFTAVGVGLVIWRVLDVPLPLAIAFGGVVAPPDAVAATAVAKRIGLPRRMVTILEGESLFNDATALVIVRMGLLAVGTSVTAWEIGVQFLWAAGGGIAIGILVSIIVGRLRRRITETITDTALSFVCPWLAYLPAEATHSSGVLAVVVAGVLLGHKAPQIQTAQSRMAERINWTTIQFLLENTVFLLIGLQAHGIIDRVANEDLGTGALLGACLAVLAATILLRPVWMFATLPIWSRGRYSLHDALRSAGVTSWAGMRGVVTLAAAFIIPEDAPHRDLLVLLALVVVAGTLLLQGFSLPWVARRLGVEGEDTREDALQTATIVERTVGAGLARLDEIAGPDTSDEVVANLRATADRRRHTAWERLGATAQTESSSAEYRRLRGEMINAEREKLLKIRDSGQVSSEVLDAVMVGTDLEESMLVTLRESENRWNERLLLLPEAHRGDCEHLRCAPDQVTPTTPEGCVDCLELGMQWVNLRICLECGNVGCCDSSPGKHAAAHFASSGHPVMRSFEPGEAWRWCFVDSLPG